MCGRFTLFVDPRDLMAAFPGFEVPLDWTPRYNIAPSQPVAVIPNTGENRIEFFRWGLIPFWAKDPKIGNRMINARSETLAEKPSFRTAYRRRRCLVLADGFFEWRKQSDKTKVPMYIQMASQTPFAFAGLWEEWHSEHGDQLLSCTIITTEPNELLASIHNRMPVILPPQAYNQWLDPAEQTASRLQPLLQPFPADQMVAYPVSTFVNNPRNESEQCTAPLNQLF